MLLNASATAASPLAPIRLQAPSAPPVPPVAFLSPILPPELSCRWLHPPALIADRSRFGVLGWRPASIARDGGDSRDQAARKPKLLRTSCSWTRLLGCSET